MRTLRLFVAVFLALIFAAGPGIAAVGSWNGVAFTGWNGVAQTSWNGTSISCASGASPLLTDLVAYWKLDEASGTTRNDSTANAQNLTDSGTTAAATGRINDGADFEFGSPTNLSHADSATLSLGTDTDFAIWAWVKMESDTGFAGGIVCKNGGADDTDEYALFYSSGAQRFVFKVAKNGTGNQIVLANNLGVPSTGVWYLLIAWHDSAADKIYIRVGTAGGSLGTTDEEVWAGGTQNGSAAFQIGAMTYNVGLVFDGVIDEVGFRKGSILSGAEQTSLFNSGSGVSYPF